MAIHAGVVDEHTVRGISNYRAKGVLDSRLTVALYLCERTVIVKMKYIKSYEWLI